MVWKNGTTGCKYTPPHDILDKKVGDFLPCGVCSEELLTMMKKSNELLKNHPVNIARMEKGLKPANSIWLWGDGKKPTLSSFSEKYGIKGAVISAVDLIKGIGICGGLQVIDVEGATGNIHTNFKGKAEATLKALADGNDFVYLHIEAPDECGHRFEIENKVRSIELIDELVVKRLVEGLKGTEFSILLLPDHPTPLCLRTHTGDPVPYILYRSNQLVKSLVNGYDELQAKATGSYVEEGHTLMDKFLKG
jgi:2,3-bisphosphoglycerate-independent phosphoglycerate mutase